MKKIKIRLPDWLTWTLLAISCFTAMLIGLAVQV